MNNISRLFDTLADWFASVLGYERVEDWKLVPFNSHMSMWTKTIRWVKR